MKKTAQKNAKTETKKAIKAASTKAAKTMKPTKETASKKAKVTTEPKATTKTAIVLGLLRREKGATIAELMRGTGWQAHSIRGFISASVGKKMGLKVDPPAGVLRKAYV